MSHHIYLDPSYLPLKWEVSSTNQTAFVGYRQGTLVDFGAHQVISGLVKLVDQNNSTLMPGYAVRINVSKMEWLGYDGEVFIPNLLKQNKLEVDLLDHGSCQVDFTYMKISNTVLKIGALCMSINIASFNQPTTFKRSFIYPEIFFGNELALPDLLHF